MHVLITGRGKGGSWQIRGVQLGEAIGAEVKSHADVSDCMGAKVVVGVKRIPDDLLKRIKAGGKPFVWDAIDAYPQPVGNIWNRERCLDWLGQELLRLQPDAVVWPTQRAQADAGWTGPQMVLPHHAWPKYQPVPTRQSVRTVGYEGGVAYVGRWQNAIKNECDLRGWAFVVNGDMQQADIGVALRDTAGYAPAHWKPGTKLANLQALGLPALCSREAGYQEIGSGSEYWIERREDLTAAFDELTPQPIRAGIAVRQQLAAPRLADVAKDYAAWLGTLV